MSSRDFLGNHLKELRVSKGVSGVQVAKLIGINQSTLSRIEAGSLRPDDKYLEGFAKALKLNKRENQELELLVLAFRHEYERWDYDDPYLIENLQKRVQVLEEHSTTLDTLCLHVVSGLLQLPKYSEAVFSKFGLLDPKHRVKAVQARQQRQTRIRASDTRIRFLLHQNTLTFALAGEEILNAQRKALSAWVSDNDSKAELRILTDRVELPSCPVTSFTIYDGKYVSVETLTTSIGRFFRDEVQRYQLQFDALWAAAERGSKARKLLS